MTQFADKLAPLAQAMGVPVPGAAPSPLDPSTVSRAALDAVRNPLTPAVPLPSPSADAPALAASPATDPAPAEMGVDLGDDTDVPEMSEADFLPEGQGDNLMYGTLPDDGSDDEFGDGVDPDTAPDFEFNEDPTAAAPEYVEPLFDDAAFGLGNDSADQIIEAAARDGQAVSLTDLAAEGDAVDAAAAAGPFDAGPMAQEDRGPTLADVLAAQAQGEGLGTELPMPETAPRTDPIQPTEIDPEFITEDMALKMAAELRTRNDAMLRAALLSILPQIYGAKTLTAENDVAIYITENAAFRDWLNAVFKKLGVELTLSDRTIDLGDGKIFLSRAPGIYDYRNAMMHLVTALDKVIEKATILDQQSNGYNQLQARLIEAQQRLTAAERERDLANNTAARAVAEAARVKPVDAFRIHWTAKGKRPDRTVAEKPCYLVINIPQDESKHKPDGTFPLNAYDVSFDPDDAHSFKSLDVAQRTLELLRSNAQRIADGKRNPYFLPRNLNSIYIVQWAHVVLPTKARTV